MREAHVTLDARTGLFDPQPFRTFIVYGVPTVAVLNPPPVELKAHIANQMDNGNLCFLVLSGGLPFVTHCFAPGQWSCYTGSVPAEDEIRTIKAFSERENAITQMLMHDAKRTQM